jgi:hypothetical protein
MNYDLPEYKHTQLLFITTTISCSSCALLVKSGGGLGMTLDLVHFLMLFLLFLLLLLLTHLNFSYFLRSETSVVATYTQDADENGNAVNNYLLSMTHFTSNSIILLNSKIETFNKSLSLSRRVQKVTASAHTLQFDASAQFTISLGSFYGVYSKYAQFNDQIVMTTP